MLYIPIVSVITGLNKSPDIKPFLPLLVSPTKSPVEREYSMYLMVLLSTGYVIPLFIILLCYIGIIIVTLIYTTGRNASMSIRNNQRYYREQKVARMVAILVLAFIGCWTPFQAKNLRSILNWQLRKDQCKKLDDYT